MVIRSDFALTTQRIITVFVNYFFLSFVNPKRNNYVDHFVIDASEVPQKKLILGSGHVLFEEMAHRVRILNYIAFV